jgi:hypothetical protein
VDVEDLRVRMLEHMCCGFFAVLAAVSFLYHTESDLAA